MKNVILTGASDGLGKAFGELCVQSGMKVIALCRTKPNYECDFIKTDLSSEKAIQSACEEIKEKYSRIDILVNCAGVMSAQKLEEIKFEELDNLMRINLLAPIFLTSQLMTLIKQSQTDILNVGSTCGTKAGYPEQLAYTTSKWGIRGTSYKLQEELKKYKNRVIQFNVGGMNTRIFAKYSGKEIENPEEWMNPVEIAKLMFYLLSLPKQIEVSDITINRKKA